MALTSEQFQWLDKLKSKYKDDNAFMSFIDEKYWQGNWERILNMYNEYKKSNSAPIDTLTWEPIGTWEFLPSNITWRGMEEKKDTTTPTEDGVKTEEPKKLIHTDLKTGEKTIVWKEEPKVEPTTPTPTTEEKKWEPIGTWEFLPSNITWRGMEEKKDTTTPTEDKKSIKTVADFKKAWSKIEDLKELIKNEYWVVWEIDWNKLVADINWERFEWTIDKAWNPIKKSLGKINTEYQAFADEKWIKTVFENWKMKFEPADLEQAIDLYNKFWEDVPVTKKSKEVISASKIYKTFSKYKDAPADVLLDWMKKWELWTWWKTWELLKKMHWGEETLEMKLAREKFEQSLKVDNINDDNKVLAWEQKVDSKVKQVELEINKLDNDFETAVKKIFANIDESYKEYKEWNETIKNLQSSLKDTASQIDELQVAKRRIMDEIRKKYPSMDTSTQIALYNQRVKAIDDQLFVLQRQYNNDLSTYKFENERLKWEYEYDVQKANQQLAMIQDLYKIKRWDLLDEKRLALAEKQIEEERKYKEEEYKRAIEQKDKEAARKFAYDLALLDYKQKLNEQNKKDIITLWWTAYLEYNRETKRYELKQAGVDGVTTTWVSTWTTFWNVIVTPWTTNRRPDRNNNPWNLKMWDVWYWVDDQGHTIFWTASEWYQALLKDLKAKQSWNTRTWLNGESTLADLGKVYAEDPNWAKWVSKLSGIPLDTKLKDIDMEYLAPYIAKQEWFTWEIKIVSNNEDVNWYITPEEVLELNAFKEAWATASEKAKYRELIKKFDKTLDKYKKEVPEVDLLNRMLRSAWASQWVSDTDLKYLREPLADYIKTWDKKPLIQAIKDTITNAKPNSSLDYINQYNDFMDFYSTVKKYTQTTDPNIKKKLANDIANKLWVDTDTTEYKAFLTSWNLDEVLRIAWTSFTDSFIETINQLNVTDKDTPETAMKKLEWRRKALYNKTRRAREFIWEDMLKELYPEYFGDSTKWTTKTEWFKKLFWNINNLDLSKYFIKQ